MNSYSESREIIPGLMIGSVNDVEKMVSWGADVLVPLAFMDANVWNTSFRGEVLYYPIEDYGVLPDVVLWDLVDKVCIRLDEGKKVGLFCAGGHGRTGYAAGCILARRGIKDPIGYLRREYSPRAVESEQQAKKIFDFIKMIKEEEKAAQYSGETNFTEETPIYGDDIPFPGEDFTYSKEDGMEALIEDIEHAVLNIQGGFCCEAVEELQLIMEGLKRSLSFREIADQARR